MFSNLMGGMSNKEKKVVSLQGEFNTSDGKAEAVEAAKLAGQKDAVHAGEVQIKHDKNFEDRYTIDENWTAAMPNQYLGQKKTKTLKKSKKDRKIKVENDSDEESDSEGNNSDDSEDSDSDVKNKLDQSESEDSGDEEECKDKKLDAKIDKKIEKKLQKKIDVDVIGGGSEGNIDKATTDKVDPDEDAFKV